MQPQGLPRDRTNPIEAPLQDGIHRDPNNIAPRAAVSWNVDGRGKTVVRAGYGILLPPALGGALMAASTVIVAVNARLLK
jgi:hypothetical protein